MASLLASAACTDLNSATNLNPEGPPEIRQVRLKEVATDASGATTTKRVFAFGTHELALTTDYPALGPNSMTTAGATGQSMRVIVDELLQGNNLEEIACRGPIDSDAYDTVPIGTTPDDIAKCAVQKDVLPTSCPGSFTHATCICKLDGGCGEVAKGDPVGVLDVNQDGASDDTRFIAGAVGIKCGAIDVPIDQNNSYWNPSGDQNRPAMGGFDALGPAIVLAPAGPMPTNLECGLSFSPSIVDKQGIAVCAPTGGAEEAGCTPGDVSAFKFKVEPLRVSNQSFQDNDMGVDKTAPILLVASAPIAAASITSITVTQGATNVPVTVTLPLPTSIRIVANAPGFAANTTYVVHITTMLTDTFGQPLPQMITYTFTTGA